MTTTALARLVAVAVFALGAGGVRADAARAPRDLAADPAATQAFLTTALARDVFVMEASFGAKYMKFTTQDARDPEIYDAYRVSPGNPLAEPEPVKVGQVDCKKSRIAWAQFDLRDGRAALDAADAIARANGFGTVETVFWGPDVFCKAPGWRVTLFAPDNTDDFMELTFDPRGKPATARRFEKTRWRKIAIADLMRGVVPAAPKPAPVAKLDVPASGASHDFRRDPGLAVKLLEDALRRPLALLSMRVSDDDVSFQVIEGDEIATYFVESDGRLREWHREKPIVFECRKPFNANDVPIARLPELADIAARSRVEMDDPRVKDMQVTRSGLCGAPEVVIKVEDDRGVADVHFDARGRMKR